MKINYTSVRRAVLTIFLLLAFAFGFATTYYVSPAGNDATGTGTIGNPWKTLSKATSTVTSSGHIIHLVAGTYTETQTSYLRPGVSIEGEGMTTTIVNSTLAGTWSTLLELNSSNGTNGNQSISALTLDGGYVNETNVKTWVGIWITARSNVQIHHCRLRNWKQSSTIFNGNTNTNPGTDVGQSFGTGNKFNDNIVTNSAAMYNGTGQGALMIGFQNGMLIYNNNIQQIERVNFANGWPIKYWNQGWLKGVKIYNNTLTKIPYSGSYPGENGNWDFALEFFNIEGLEIYGNTIQGAIDMAYNYRGAYAYCAWIHDNILSHPVQGTRIEGAIIFEYRTEGAIVENNTINNKTYGVTFNTRGFDQNGDDRYYLPGGPPVGGYSYIVDCVIRKNLFSNIYAGTGIGNRFAIGVISESTDDPQINNMQIYNNTIVAKTGDPAYVGLDFTSQPNGNCSGLYVRNNIVTGFSNAWLKGSNGATNIANCMVTHNDAFSNGSSNAPSWPAGNPSSYTYTNNLAVNPQFVSTTDFHLQPTSTLIDLGVNVGIPFTGTAPDRGYAEFGSGSLPIKLIDFTVRDNNGKNLLNWNTATEVNSDYFNIERSGDAQTYQVIGRVNASGFSQTEMKYSFTDANPLKGMNYYRLVMVDKDATQEYSKIVSISSRENNSLSISYVDLSSGTNTATINVNSAQAQSANLSIIDVSGRTILNTSIQLQQGVNNISKRIPSIPGGIYYVKLFTASDVVVKSTLSRN